MTFLIPWVLRLAVLVGVVVAGHWLIEQLTGWLGMTLMPHPGAPLHWSIIAALVLYVVLLAIPFVPGAEIGLTLMTVLGSQIAPLIYLATTLSLSIAFALGRFLPPQVLAHGFAVLGLQRAAEFIGRASAMGYEDFHQAFLPEATPKALRFVLRFRYVALALALNMPGNFALGGGGGIALVAGLSRLFAPVPFVLTILIAVLPVPLAFYLAQM